MTVTAKCTFILRYKQAGYSFNLFNVCPSLESLGNPSAGPKGPIHRLWLSFLPLLGQTVEGPYVRISDEALRGDSLFYDLTYITISTEAVPLTGINVVNVKTIIPDFPDFYDTAALVVLAASTTQKGRFFMRFIPDSIINYPIGLNPDRNWDNQFETFKKQLIADKWCVRCLADANVQKPLPIQKVTRTAPGENLLVTTFATHGYAAQDVVRLSRVQGSPNINGVYTVDTVPTGNTFTLANTSGTALGGYTLGTARRRIVQYPQITNAGYRYVTRRKAGRPFGAPVGRRKKTKTSL